MSLRVKEINKVNCCCFFYTYVLIPNILSFFPLGGLFSENVKEFRSSIGKMEFVYSNDFVMTFTASLDCHLSGMVQRVEIASRKYFHIFLWCLPLLETSVNFIFRPQGGCWVPSVFEETEN